MVRRALTRQTRWYQNRCSTFMIKDFIIQKTFWKFWNFDPWWPQFWPEPKNDWYDFEMIFRELSNAVFRFVLRCAGADIDGGCSNTHPPPSGGGISRGPSGRGLSKTLHCPSLSNHASIIQLMIVVHQPFNFIKKHVFTTEVVYIERARSYWPEAAMSRQPLSVSATTPDSVRLASGHHQRHHHHQRGELHGYCGSSRRSSVFPPPRRRRSEEHAAPPCGISRNWAAAPGSAPTALHLRPCRHVGYLK